MSAKVHAKPKRAGGDKRGNSHDRRVRKCKLLAAYPRCVFCRVFLTWSIIEADRIVPGGPYAMGNVQGACKWCNRAKSDNPNWTFGGDDK